MNYLVPFHPPVRQRPKSDNNSLAAAMIENSLRNLPVAYWTEVGRVAGRFKHFKQCHNGQPGAVYEITYVGPHGRRVVSGYLYTLNTDLTAKEVCKLYARVE